MGIVTCTSRIKLVFFTPADHIHVDVHDDRVEFDRRGVDECAGPEQPALLGIEPGERVVIHGGAGGVGLAALQIAKWRGAEVFTTAGSPEKRALLRLMGADHVLDSRSLEFADQIMEITGGELRIGDEHSEYQWMAYEACREVLHWHSNQNALHELNHRIIHRMIPGSRQIC